MATNPDNWEAIKGLFEAALELKPEERPLFLQENCSDLGVRAELGRLLTEHEGAGSFLSVPILGSLVYREQAVHEN